MNYSQLDDVVLLRLIMDAEAKALDELYTRYGRLVYTIAHRVIGDQAMAEEITLDIFTRVWQKADTFRSERGNVRTWLAGMTRNRAVDMLRRNSTYANTQQKLWAEALALPQLVERGPETAVDLQMKKERIRAAIHQLSTEQRDLLALAYFQGHTQSEIAKLRNLPLGTVKTRIRAGIQKLRQLLKEENVN